MVSAYCFRASGRVFFFFFFFLMMMQLEYVVHAYLNYSSHIENI